MRCGETAAARGVWPQSRHLRCRRLSHRLRLGMLPHLLLAAGGFAAKRSVHGLLRRFPSTLCAMAGEASCMLARRRPDLLLGGAGAGRRRGRSGRRGAPLHAAHGEAIASSRGRRRCAARLARSPRSARRSPRRSSAFRPATISRARPARLRGAAIFLLALPLAFPPVASGLMLLYVLGSQFAGSAAGSRRTELPVPDTLLGVGVAEFFVSGSFVAIAATAAFGALDPDLRRRRSDAGGERVAHLRADRACRRPPEASEPASRSPGCARSASTGRPASSRSTPRRCRSRSTSRSRLRACARRSRSATVSSCWPPSCSARRVDFTPRRRTVAMAILDRLLAPDSSFQKNFFFLAKRFVPGETIESRDRSGARTQRRTGCRQRSTSSARTCSSARRRLETARRVPADARRASAAAASIPTSR